MKKQKIDNELLKKLQKGVGHGGIKAIAKNLELSSGFVSEVLRGVKESEVVILAAIELTEINEKRQKEIDQKIRKAVRNIKD